MDQSFVSIPRAFLQRIVEALKPSLTIYEISSVRLQCVRYLEHSQKDKCVISFGGCPVAIIEDTPFRTPEDILAWYAQTNPLMLRQYLTLTYVPVTHKKDDDDA